MAGKLRHHLDFKRTGERLRLRDLHVLLAVVQFGSLTRAAAQLSLSQPAVSQAIAEMEAVAGSSLFYRGPTGAALTPAGTVFAIRTRAALDEMQQAMEEVRSIGDPGRGTVNVAADMSFVANGALVAIIEDLSRRHPGIGVHVVETTTRTRQPDFHELRTRDVDVALGRPPAQAQPKEFKVEKLLDEALVVMAGAAHPLSRLRRAGLADLKDAEWVLASSDNLARELLSAALARAGLSAPNPRITTYSMTLRMQLLRSGRYLTVAGEHACKHLRGPWNVIQLPINLGGRLDIAAVTLQGRSATPAVGAFLASVRRVAATMRASPTTRSRSL